VSSRGEPMSFKTMLSVVKSCLTTELARIELLKNIKQLPGTSRQCWVLASNEVSTVEVELEKLAKTLGRKIKQDKKE
jgi:hypothetical protein